MNKQLYIGLAAGVTIAVALSYFLDSPAIGISVGILLGAIYSGVFGWRRRPHRDPRDP